jgi:hypothetical protein
MARVTVVPDDFRMVSFDAGRIAELASEVADRIGLRADVELRIEVNESSPLTRTRIQSLDPVVLAVEGGAFEDPRRLRQMSDRSVVDVLGRLLHRVWDHLDPAFGSPPPDNELTAEQQAAWDAYAVGRSHRLGLVAPRERRLYHFRNRHGFTDVADAAFARLWDASSLKWADIDGACAETAAARPPPPTRGRGR